MSIQNTQIAQKMSMAVVEKVKIAEIAQIAHIVKKSIIMSQIMHKLTKWKIEYCRKLVNAYFT